MKEEQEISNEAVELARSTFLRDDNYYGCAESTLVALQSIFGLPDPEDSSAAMALNGGIAHSGGMCGAISGAAMALGELAEIRLGNHREAKRTARLLTRALMADFEAEFGSSNCRNLIAYEISIPAEHDAFITSNVWRTICMRQIEFSVAKLAPLADQQVWQERLTALET
jgi:C_GCAxxG_C_C family probable redox protein